MIKARDVAAETGLSVSTIGRALADDPRISDETKSKVRRAAERLGYVGNSAAQIMRGRSSKLIGLMIPDVANDFYATVAQTMSDCLDRHGYRLLLSLTQDEAPVELRHVRELIGARASGVILVPTAAPLREARNLLAGVRHVQFLRRIPALDAPWFGMDDKVAIQGAAAHLAALGHHRIAYLGGHLTLSTGAARVQGYRAALQSVGVATNPTLERLGPPTAAFGQRACAELLGLAEPPTALVTGSVHITEGVIAELEERRVEVPRTLSVIGFGAAPWFSWWRGGLTAVAPPVQELATSCALWLLDQLATKPSPQSGGYTAVVGSTFIVRRSTGPVPAALPAPAPTLRGKSTRAGERPTVPIASR